MSKRSSSSSSPTPTDPVVAFDELLARVQACTVCAAQLPHPPRPILRVSSTARLLIVGQAPGRRVHETAFRGTTRRGLAAAMAEHDARAVLRCLAHRHRSNRLCYPGTVKGSDLPPRPECAPLWHPPLRAAMPQIRLTLLIGAYARRITSASVAAARLPTRACLARFRPRLCAAAASQSA